MFTISTRVFEILIKLAWHSKKVFRIFGFRKPLLILFLANHLYSFVNLIFKLSQQLSLPISLTAHLNNNMLITISKIAM